MPKISIYDTDHHCFTWPESGFDNDTMRDQARRHTEGKYGSPNPESTTIHHHKNDKPCIGYMHEQYHPGLPPKSEEALTEEQVSIYTK